MRRRKSTVTRNLFLSISLLALSCAVRPPPTAETARGAVVSLVNSAAIDSMRGSGSVAFGRNNEQVSVSFDITWAGDSSFEAQFSTPLGMTVATIRPQAPGTWSVEAGDSRYTVRPAETIHIGQDFLDYPVTWEEFILIMTGRLPCISTFSSAPDSQYAEKKNSVLVWKSRPCGGRAVDIVGKIDNKTQRLTELLFAGKENGGWSLALAGFRGSHAKEYKFVQTNNNYFYVKYHSMKFHPAAGTRKAMRS
jgi:hypothetical protein